MRQLELEKFTEYAYPHGISWNPAGTMAAVVRSVCDLEHNGYSQTLYLLKDGEFSPVLEMRTSRTFFWKDDRHILYPSKRENDRTEYTELDVETGTVRVYPALPICVRELRRLDSGKYAVIARIDANCPDYYKLSPEEKAAEEQRREDEQGFHCLDELPFYCNGDTYVNKKRNALFIADLEAGTCERITEPLFFVDYYCVDGGTVYYAGEAYRQQPTLSRKLFRYDTQSGQTRPLITEEGYNITGLTVCDGRLLMFGNRFTPKGRRRHRAFYGVDQNTGAVTLLNDYPHNMMNSVACDCNFGMGREVRVDGDKLYFVSTYGHNSWLMRADADGNIQPVIKPDGYIHDFDVQNGKILLICQLAQKLLEVYTAEIDGGDGILRQCSRFNEGLLDGYYTAKPEPLTFRSHGLEIEGWVLKPKDYDPEKTYPAILDIHGGPNFVYGTVFFHEMQLWANRGFFVFFCNPEGSEGRGDAFMDIRGRYGCEDYETLMTFTDEVLAAYPQIDAGRLCVTGGSYGGFMTNWIVGHTDRFCCAATQRSISNWVSMAGTGDHSYHFAYDQTDADLAEEPEKMWAQSPMKYLKNVKTPILVFHSDKDYRCPLEQGLQWFSALTRRGVETKMCIVDGENHGLSRGGRPRQRIRRLQELTNWMEDHSGQEREK